MAARLDADRSARGGRLLRTRNGSTASTAKSAKDAKDAKEEDDLKAFALLGVLGALGGECRCLKVFSRSCQSLERSFDEVGA